MWLYQGDRSQGNAKHFLCVWAVTDNSCPTAIDSVVLQDVKYKKTKYKDKMLNIQN